MYKECKKCVSRVYHLCVTYRITKDKQCSLSEDKHSVFEASRFPEYDCLIKP